MGYMTGRYFRKRRPARRYRRRRISRKPLLRLRRRNVWGPLTSFPKTKYCHFRYVEPISFTVNASGIYTHYFRANSCHDPNYGGTGHQPMGWDQVAPFYEHYIVHKAKCSISWGSQGGVSVDQVLAVACYQDNSSTMTATSLGTLLEQGKTRYKTLSADGQNGRTVRTVSWFGAKKAFGVKNVIDNIDSLGAAVGYNPTQDYYFVLVIDPDIVGQFTAGAGYLVTAMVTIDYYVSLHEKVDMSES